MSKIIINRNDLLRQLNKIKFVNKNDFENNIILFSDHTISIYNGIYFIYIPFKTGLNCAISGNEFIQFLSKLKNNKLVVTESENSIFIKNKNTTAEFYKINDALMQKNISDTISDISEWKKLPKDFFDGINYCLLSVANDVLAPIISNLYLNKNIIASTDNYRISEYKLKNGHFPEILIPADFIKEALKFGINKYAIIDNNIYFSTNDDVIIYSLMPNEKFPNYKNLLSENGIKITLPEELKNIIDIEKIITTSEAKNEQFLNIKITKDCLYCTAKNAAGNINSKIKIEFDINEEIEFSIHPDHLQMIMGYCNSMLLQKNTVLFQNENFKHLIVLKEKE